MPDELSWQGNSRQDKSSKVDSFGHSRKLQFLQASIKLDGSYEIVSCAKLDLNQPSRNPLWLGLKKLQRQVAVICDCKSESEMRRHLG